MTLQKTDILVKLCQRTTNDGVSSVFAPHCVNAITNPSPKTDRNPKPNPIFNANPAILEKWVPYSQRYLFNATLTLTIMLTLLTLTVTVRVTVALVTLILDTVVNKAPTSQGLPLTLTLTLTLTVHVEAIVRCDAKIEKSQRLLLILCSCIC